MKMGKIDTVRFEIFIFYISFSFHSEKFLVNRDIDNVATTMASLFQRMYFIIENFDLHVKIIM